MLFRPATVGTPIHSLLDIDSCSSVNTDQTKHMDKSIRDYQAKGVPLGRFAEVRCVTIKHNSCYRHFSAAKRDGWTSAPPSFGPCIIHDRRRIFRWWVSQMFNLLLLEIPKSFCSPAETLLGDDEITQSSGLRESSRTLVHENIHFHPIELQRTKMKYQHEIIYVRCLQVVW